MPDTTTRRVELAGCRNVRDLGGYPTRDGRRVRTGRLYRGDSPHMLDASDVAILLQDRRIASVIDLRTEAEVQRYGIGPLVDVPRHHVCLIDAAGRSSWTADREVSGLGGLYTWLVFGGAGAIADVMRLLAAPDALPALVHCTAGKDRTGIVAAAVLGSLGVPDEHVIADYAATEPVDPAGMTGVLGAPDTYPPEFLEARAETMADLLEIVRWEFGGFRGYLGSHGVDEDALAALERGLLE